MYRRLLFLSIATALFAARASANATTTAAETPPAATPSSASVGGPAPSFAGHLLADGRPVTNADYSGKILVLNFWATWCPPCRRETPDMISAFRKLGGGDVAFLGVDTTEVPSVVKTFVSAKGVSYPVAIAGAQAYNAFAIAYIPTTVVIDRQGIVRARWTGELDPKRLADFVADARVAKNYTLDTPDQTLVDKLLDPAAYDLTTADRYDAAAARIEDNVAVVDAFTGAHGSGKDATVDYTRTLAEEGALQMLGARRAAALATTPERRVAADRLLAAADGKLDRFDDAIVALEDARTLAPTDATLDLEIARADYRLHEYDAGIAAAKAYTAAVPGDPDGWSFLGLLAQRSGRFADAAPAYEKTNALLEAAVGAAKSPADRQDAIANVADDALDLANVYVALGDLTNTRRAFAIANRYGDRLDPHGRYANLYTNVHERTQEGSIAVRLARGGKTALSVAPWTGPDLPGSVASTLKYRLIVASAPSGKLDLRAIGLPPGWVASFCADGLCSPNRVSLALPDSGVKTYEFQLVPPGASHAAGKVTIVTSDGVTALVPTRA